MYESTSSDFFGLFTSNQKQTKIERKRINPNQFHIDLESENKNLTKYDIIKCQSTGVETDFNQNYTLKPLNAR